MKATVLMRQPGRVQEIVGALRRGGRDRLQVPPGEVGLARGAGGGGEGGRRASCPCAFPRGCGTCKPSAARNDPVGSPVWGRAHLPQNSL